MKVCVEGKSKIIIPFAYHVRDPAQIIRIYHYFEKAAQTNTRYKLFTLPSPPVYQISPYIMNESFAEDLLYLYFVLLRLITFFCCF